MLVEDGIQLGRFLIGRLIDQLGLICKQSGPYKYKQATVERLGIPNRLNREFAVETPNRVWYGDIAYIWARTRWVDLAVVISLYACKVVGRAISNNADGNLAIKALQDAYNRRGNPEAALFHSDQGSQYNSTRFRQRLWRYRFEQSMNHCDNCWDNAPMERLKTKWVPRLGYGTMAEAQIDIGRCLMDYYNCRRHT